MKLVVIFARELVEWPNALGHAVGQASDGTLHCELEPVDAEIVRTIEKYTLCKHFLSDIVTRAEWQAAVEALKFDTCEHSYANKLGCPECGKEQPFELKWPDGAEFVGDSREGEKCFYRNIVNGSYEFTSDRGVNWYRSSGEPLDIPLTPRPTERAVEWDGVGLPPDKCEVEFEHELCGWLCVKVVGFDGDLVVVRHQDEYLAVSTKRMRPIRTQEQIEAEEREKAIQEICTTLGWRNIRSDGSAQEAAALYDAGYRKQVAK